jgi:ferric-dicitrate binding protein FerR (iron transport regulator)
MKFHKWVIEERDKLAAHAPNPSEAAKVGAALSAPEQKDRRVEGIVIFAASHVLIDDVGVRQLGGLASELAKQTAEKAQEQQDIVLKDAQQLNLDSLYQLPTLGTWPPAEGDTEDGEGDGA